MTEQQRIRRERLRWHCRRALLELDIVFQRFWARTGDELDDATAATLERLLEMEDHDLWELVSGRTATDDPQIKGMVDSLRALRAADGHG
ncbi:MAG: succinate dehydrogenase assembly factor 2 [Rhodocyclaceae bacterium]|nr:succinate dehydrogenase assembly factor 2 [Rhodocyclaceae bacterium]